VEDWKTGRLEVKLTNFLPPGLPDFQTSSLSVFPAGPVFELYVLL